MSELEAQQALESAEQQLSNQLLDAGEDIQTEASAPQPQAEESSDKS